MGQDEITSRFELFLDAVDIDRVRYHYVSKGVLERGEKKIKREGRYDTEENVIELQGTYYVDGEVVEMGDWVQMASVSDEGRVSNADGSWSGDDLEDAIAQFLKWDFFFDPEAELGEIFYDATGHE